MVTRPGRRPHHPLQPAHLPDPARTGVQAIQVGRRPDLRGEVDRPVGRPGVVPDRAGEVRGELPHRVRGQLQGVQVALIQPPGGRIGCQPREGAPVRRPARIRLGSLVVRDPPDLAVPGVHEGDLRPVRVVPMVLGPVGERHVPAVGGDGHRVDDAVSRGQGMLGRGVRVRLDPPQVGPASASLSVRTPVDGDRVVTGPDRIPGRTGQAVIGHEVDHAGVRTPGVPLDRGGVLGELASLAAIRTDEEELPPAFVALVVAGVVLIRAAQKRDPAAVRRPARISVALLRHERSRVGAVGPHHPQVAVPFVVVPAQRPSGVQHPGPVRRDAGIGDADEVDGVIDREQVALDRGRAPVRGLLRRDRRDHEQDCEGQDGTRQRRGPQGGSDHGGSVSIGCPVRSGPGVEPGWLQDRNRDGPLATGSPQRAGTPSTAPDRGAARRPAACRGIGRRRNLSRSRARRPRRSRRRRTNFKRSP